MTTRILAMSTLGNETHIKRILKDLREFYKENSKEIFIVPTESNITDIFALIIGPKDTPYENGFFYFKLSFPNNYPLSPPSVKLLTTGNKRVRFNPNLYSNGMVCLSILGTFSGPAWSPAQTLFSVLLSIQSLLNEKPYHNEPGFEEQKLNARNSLRYFFKDTTTEVNNYNEMITHETIRVAVIEMLNENSSDACNMHPALKNVMISHFTANYQFYEELIESKQHLDGKAIKDPFNDLLRPKEFQYKNLLENIQRLKITFVQESEVEGFQAKPADPLAATYDKIVKEIIGSDKTQCMAGELLDDFMDEMDDDLSFDYTYESESDEENQVD